MASNVPVTYQLCTLHWSTATEPFSDVRNDEGNLHLALTGNM